MSRGYARTMSPLITVFVIARGVHNCFFALPHAGVHAFQGTGGVQMHLACGVQYLVRPLNALGHYPVFYS